MKQTVVLATLACVTVALFPACKKDKAEAPAKVLYETDFNSDDGQWPTGRLTTGVNAVIQNGFYNISSSSSSYYVYTAPRFERTTTGMAIEANISVSAIDNGAATIYPGGLAWNINATGNRVFMFGIYPAGQFAIGGWSGTGGFVSYRDPAASSAVRTNGYNTLRIELKGNKLYFFVNGTQVHDMAAVTGNSLDLPGLILGGPNVLVRADYFRAVAL